MTDWSSLPFSRCVIDVSAGNLKVQKADYLRSGQYAVVDQGRDLIGGYCDDSRFLYKGELPVVVFGDHTRAFKYVDFPFCPGADGVKILRPAPQIDAKYLYYFLARLNIPSAGYSRHFKFLKESQIAVPPSAEQLKIVEVLDRVNALRHERRKAVALLDGLAQSIFLDMFGSPVTNPMGWPVRPLREIGRVLTGNTPSRSEATNYGSEIEWIKSDNIDDSSIYLTPAIEGLSVSGMKSARIVEPGSLLVTCIAGSPASIGNVAIANRRVAFNQQINALTPFHANVLFLYFQLLLAKPLVREKSTGGMKGIVSKSRFESVILPDPPHARQVEFARRVQAALQLQAAHRSHLAELDTLFASLQQRAFRGDLRPQGTDSAA